MVDKIKLIKNLNKCKLIIGNGFDLSCGLNSSYKDFFEADKEHYKMLINALNESYNYAFANFLTGKNYFMSIDKQLRLSSIFNIWDCFFAISFDNKDSNILWCDIEYEMKKSLVKDGQTSFWERVFEYTNNSSADISKEKECMCCIFLTTKNIKGKYKNLFEFYNYLLEELNKFELRFGKFIKKQIDDTYIRIANETVNKITSNITSIDSFNYTNFKYDKYKNINGDINDIEENQWTSIFGIDSTNIAPNMPEYIFTKAYRKLMIGISRTSTDELYDFENVIIYGHSLNEQDYNYFFPIFDYLKLNVSTEHNKLVILYKVYDLDKKQNIINKIITNLSAMLFSYDKYTNNKFESRLMEMLIAENRIILCDIKKFDN